MAFHLPKQTLMIFIFCVLAVGGVAFYTNMRSRDISAAAAPSQLAVVPADIAPLPETNWRVQFLDATSSSAAFKAPPAVKTPVATKNLTPTYKLGQNFFTQYANLRRSGLTADSQTVSSVMDQVIDATAQGISKPRQYLLKDISIVADGSASFKTYSAIIEELAMQYSLREDESVLASQAFEDGDLADLSALDATAATYQSMIVRLRSTPVPQSLVAAHLDLLNSLSALSYSTQAFRKMDTDPLTALAAVKLDALASLDTNDVFSAIQNFLKANTAQQGT